MAPAVSGFHGLAFLRGGMIAAAPRAAIRRVEDPDTRITIEGANIVTRTLIIFWRPG